jgi:hypothetical protein
MMEARTLAELFADAKGPVIDWRGHQVHAIYELHPAPARFTVEFATARESPVQGIRFRVRGGLLTANDVTADDIVLWHDTAPSRVDIRLEANAPAISLKVWNVWRGGMETILAWTGNAGFLAVGRNGSLDLMCSDGEGDVSFDDLHVRIIES